MEGSCCVAVLEGAPAHDAPCPSPPRLKQAERHREISGGNSSSMVLLWWCQRDIKEGGMRMAMDKGQRVCVSSRLIGGFTAIWESSCEGAD